VDTGYSKEKAYITVIAYIKQLVQDGQLAFGGKLPSEREMMATLGLGRNSIREALRTLENMGLISCVHGKGNFLVNQIGESFSSVFSMLLFLKQSNFDEVQQLRRGLETQSLLLAIQTADCTTASAQSQWRQTLKPLGKLVENMRQATGHERVTLDSAFHEALIQCSGNRLFAVLQKAVSSLCEAAIENVLTTATDAQWQTLVDCHETIYRSLLNRNPQAGMAAIDQHYAQLSPENQTTTSAGSSGELPGDFRAGS
jgi:GntR family transcriptional repressor for pyruvate dehydrogenase complex